MPSSGLLGRDELERMRSLDQVGLLKGDHVPALLAHIEELETRAGDLLMRAYRDEEDWRSNSWFKGVEELFPARFPKREGP